MLSKSSAASPAGSRGCLGVSQASLDGQVGYLSPMGGLLFW